jgi:hypothetical protein
MFILRFILGAVNVGPCGNRAPDLTLDGCTA